MEFSEDSVSLIALHAEHTDQEAFDLIKFKPAVIVGVELPEDFLELIKDHFAESFSGRQALILVTEGIMNWPAVWSHWSFWFAWAMGSKVEVQEDKEELVADVSASTGVDSRPEVRKSALTGSATNFADAVSQDVLEFFLIHLSCASSFEIGLSVEPLDGDDSKVVLNNEVNQFLIGDLAIVIEVISVGNVEDFTLVGSEQFSKCIFDFTGSKLIVMINIEAPQQFMKLLSNFLGEVIVLKLEVNGWADGCGGRAASIINVWIRVLFFIVFIDTVFLFSLVRLADVFFNKTKQVFGVGQLSVDADFFEDGFQDFALEISDA